MNFEEEMEKLDAICAEMSRGDITLERSMALYTEAVERTKKLREYIDTAKLTIEKLEQQ
ncbi:MAG: exodeoxyribonuclease VII small subunit [Ruminococcaceae bacterium]|nr:exodeoxyribonuclease VII small subunit [Oscillospiraceae bacterium]